MLTAVKNRITKFMFASDLAKIGIKAGSRAEKLKNLCLWYRDVFFGNILVPHDKVYDTLGS